MMNPDFAALGFGPDVQRLTNVDFNALTDSGIYMVMRAGSVNGPTGDGASQGLTHVISSTWASTYIRQVFYATSNADVWLQLVRRGCVTLSKSSNNGVKNA